MTFQFLPALSVAALTALALSAPPAAAAEWVVDPEGSTITFDYIRDDAPAQGVFAVFDGTGTFDPERPEKARLKIAIHSESIDLGDAVESAFATSAEWFDSANHPHVSYVLNALEHVEGDTYNSIGTLTIRGQHKVIRSPVTLTIAEDGAHAIGTVEVDRKEFGLGVGPSSLFVDIEREVAVSFDLRARPLE